MLNDTMGLQLVKCGNSSGENDFSILLSKSQAVIVGLLISLYKAFIQYFSFCGILFQGGLTESDSEFFQVAK